MMMDMRYQKIARGLIIRATWITSNRWWWACRPTRQTIISPVLEALSLLWMLAQSFRNKSVLRY